MNESRLEEQTRQMRPWGAVRQRIRLAREAFKDIESDVVIWAEPLEWQSGKVKNYEVKIVPAAQFQGAHPDAVWE